MANPDGAMKTIFRLKHQDTTWMLRRVTLTKLYRRVVVRN